MLCLFELCLLELCLLEFWLFEPLELRLFELIGLIGLSSCLSYEFCLF